MNSGASCISFKANKKEAVSELALHLEETSFLVLVLDLKDTINLSLTRSKIRELGLSWGPSWLGSCDSEGYPLLLDSSKKHMCLDDIRRDLQV